MNPSVFPQPYAAIRFYVSIKRKPFWRRSTATIYATIFRATVRVARFALPRCFSLSQVIARAGLFRAAIFAALMRIVSRCVLRRSESNVRLVLARRNVSDQSAAKKQEPTSRLTDRQFK